MAHVKQLIILLYHLFYVRLVIYLLVVLFYFLGNSILFSILIVDT